MKPRTKSGLRAAGVTAKPTPVVSFRDLVIQAYGFRDVARDTGEEVRVLPRQWYAQAKARLRR
jgi:hypothetical protein